MSDAITAHLAAGETLGDRILKVDHAGENGAVCIYRAQIFVCRWRAPSVVTELEDFLRHELHHRAIFGTALAQRGQRRCRSYHLCGLGGFALGFVTALLGRGAVAATTVAVERVVLGHLEHQLIALKDIDRPAYEAIASIVSDEQTHHDRSQAAQQNGSLWPALLEPIVAASTEAVIWLGMHL